MFFVRPLYGLEIAKIGKIKYGPCVWIYVNSPYARVETGPEKAEKMASLHMCGN